MRLICLLYVTAILFGPVRAQTPASDTATQIPAVETVSQPVGSIATTPAARNDTLREIILAGNERTLPEIMHLYLRLDTGAVCDSAILEEARQRLLSTRAFLSVKIIQIRKPEGVNAYVIVKEYPRYHLTDIGGQLYYNIYGRKPDFWESWRIRTGLRVGNIRGRLQTFNISLHFWEWRNLSAFYTWPLLPGPYYISSGIGLASYPFLASPWRSNTLSATVLAGRRMGNEARAYARLSPIYNRITYEGPSSAGSFSERTFFDTLLTQSSVTHTDDQRLHTLDWRDTVRISPDTVAIRTWNGNSRWAEDQQDRRFFDIALSTGALYRRADENYPIRKGWYAWSEVGVNVPIPDNPSSHFYTEYQLQLRAYHNAPWPRNSSVAWRGQALLRTSDGGQFHILETGSEHTIRGFGSGGLGLRSRANNRVAFTTEYRFPMLSTPAVRLPGIVKLVVYTQDISYRFDGALFVDFAHLWHQLEHPLTQTETAVATGFGIRLIANPAKRAACFDFVPAAWYNGELVTRLTDTRTWGWHFYVDLAY